MLSACSAQRLRAQSLCEIYLATPNDDDTNDDNGMIALVAEDDTRRGATIVDLRQDVCCVFADRNGQQEGSIGATNMFEVCYYCNWRVGNTTM